MKIRRTAQAASVIAVGALVLAACTSDADPEPGDDTTTGAEETEDPDTEDPDDDETDGDDEFTGLHDLGDITTQPGSIFYSTGQDEFTGYNTIKSGTYSTYNNIISARISSGFMYYGTDGTIYQNEDFGSFEVISGLDSEDEPLVVEYTIADDAVWSDGTPITNIDYLYDWATQNPEFLPQGEDALFDNVSATFALEVPDGPQPVDELGGKVFTVEYANHYPDYQLVVSSSLPAHVAARESGLTAEELGQAILDRDAETVGSTADFWNDGWLSQPGEVPAEDIAPSSGPYRLQQGGWTAGQFITLEANPEYWGPPAATENLVIRFADSSTHVQSLANQDLNVIQPQATTDVVSSLEELGDLVEIQTGSLLTWEHLDFNFREADEEEDYAGSVFSDSQGGFELREAFALCVPREEIVANLIQPVNPDAEVLNAREVFNFQPNYDEVVEAAYDGQYDEVDLDAASALVEASGIETPIDVRIGYSAPNPRRADTVSAIKSSCDQVGFNVIDSGSADFFSVAQVAGDWEISLFAWAGSGQIASGANIYSTGRPQNYGEYSNSTVDEAWAELGSSLDPEVHLEQVKIIERGLWETLHGIPLYAHPGLVAHTAGMENVRFTSTQNQVPWNAQQWILPE